MAISIERTTDQVTLIITGLITTEDLYRGVDSLYESEPPRKVLWDFSAAVVPAPSDVPDATEQLRDFSTYATTRGQ